MFGTFAHENVPGHVLGLAIVDDVAKLDVSVILELLEVLLTLAVGAWGEAKLCQGVCARGALLFGGAIGLGVAL